MVVAGSEVLVVVVEVVAGGRGCRLSRLDRLRNLWGAEEKEKEIWMVEMQI